MRIKKYFYTAEDKDPAYNTTEEVYSRVFFKTADGQANIMSLKSTIGGTQCEAAQNFVGNDVKPSATADTPDHPTLGDISTVCTDDGVSPLVPAIIAHPSTLPIPISVSKVFGTTNNT